MNQFCREKIVHRPLVMPRKGHVEEQIYLDLWLEFIARRPDDVGHIFYGLLFKFDQRAAQVAASFMVYLGCNLGASLIHEAESYAREHIFCSRPRAFLAAWAVHNQRMVGVSNGIRAVEVILNTLESNGFRGLIETHRPSVTLRDIDIIECMVQWMSTPQGEALRNVADVRIEAARAEARLAQQGYYEPKSLEVL